jgi:predicted exporter
MTGDRRWVLVLWLAGLAVCALVIARANFTADLSAFLPRSPSPEQRLLVDQLRDGVVSRLILVGLEGAPPDVLARVSRELAAKLRQDAAIAAVTNGDGTGLEADRAYVWNNRYLLSSAVTPERFTANGLRQALEEDLRLLQSPGGMFLKRALPNDPTAEILHLTDRLTGGGGGPATRDGVWFSADGGRSLLLVQTRVPGFDMEAQAAIIQRIRDTVAEAGPVRVVMTGPAVFSVATRDTIEADVKRSSILATALVAGVLLAVYRSPRVLALSLLPAASGTLAGIAAVSLGFGTVHGITLGFGVTLLGETVDYAIYLFTQTMPGERAERTLPRIWRTLLLGMLTSVVGFGTMLLSSFSGLAQLGLFSIVGLVVALGVTRWILPVLLPSRFSTDKSKWLGPVLMRCVAGAPKLRPVLLLAVIVSVGWLAFQRGDIWSGELTSLSPVSKADQDMDERLRRDIGAPDPGHLLVVTAPDQDAALAAAEELAEPLQSMIGAGLLSGYESPANYLPSQAAQRARQAALPERETLRANLEQALEGLPFRADVFEPFLNDAAAAKSAPLLNVRSLEGTTLLLRLDSLLIKSGDGWAAMLPLRGVSDPRALGEALGNRAVLLDLKAESDRLYRTYRQEALMLALAGSLAIMVLLGVSLRSVWSLGGVVVPLAAAVVLTLALLTAARQQFSIFHLVGLLLVVGVGSNYSLLFERVEPLPALRERTVSSVAIANLCTVIGFGTLSFSSIPVLHGIGLTVAVGAFLSLVFSAILSAPRERAVHA